MQIYNLHSESKKEAEDLKVVSYEEFDKDGEMVTNNYVEYIVVGKNRKWKDLMLVDDFKKFNPDIKVKGLN